MSLKNKLNATEILQISYYICALGEMNHNLSAEERADLTLIILNVLLGFLQSVFIYEAHMY